MPGRAGPIRSSRALPKAAPGAPRHQFGCQHLQAATRAGPRRRGLPGPRGRAGRVCLGHVPSPFLGIPAGVPARRTWPVSVIATSRWHFTHSVRSRGEGPDAWGTVTAMGTRHRLHVGRTFVVTVTIVFRIVRKRPRASRPAPSRPGLPGPFRRRRSPRPRAHNGGEPRVQRRIAAAAPPAGRIPRGRDLQKPLALAAAAPDGQH